MTTAHQFTPGSSAQPGGEPHGAAPARKQQGQALVEFALTVPILMMFVLGIIDLARVLFSFAQTVDAARQGVRYGIVTGLENNQMRYLDCTGIDTAARKLPGLVKMSGVEVKIFYEDSKGNKLTDCVGGLSAWDVGDGDVLAVQVNGSVKPITPVLRMFTSSLSFGYTSRRTIQAEGSAYTSEWPAPPSAASNFTATVNCSQATNNVSFSWTPLNPIPDRAEIHNSLTGQVVVVLDDQEPGLITNAYCNNCAAIPTSNGFGMYYLVTYNGTSPSVMAGPSSQDATVMCNGQQGSNTGGSGTGAVSGIVWYDKNGDGQKGNGEKGIASVSITLKTGGNDGTLGTYDDVSYAQTTDSDGSFSFTGLSVPFGLSGQVYRLDVAGNSASLDGKLLTTGNEPLNIYLTDGQSYTSAAFGYDDAH